VKRPVNRREIDVKTAALSDHCVPRHEHRINDDVIVRVAGGGRPVRSFFATDA
jgi:hypothetical protein